MSYEERAAKVRANYTFTKEGDLYVATNKHFGYDKPTRFTSPDKETTRRYARCHWGHFNYRVDAEAFDTIFGPEAQPTETN